MSFTWPFALFGLFLIPLLALILRRLNGRTNNPTMARLGRGAVAEDRRVGRQLPVWMFLLSLSALLVGFARPHATIDVPQIRSKVVLAFDTSSSMAADDLDPTRLTAAKVAAVEFVDEQPGAVEIGVVSFGSGGVVTMRPTDDRVAILSAIDRLEPAGGTSLSQGLFAAMSAIANGPMLFDPTNEDAPTPSIDFGSFGSSIIIMFSDGEDTSEHDPTALTELAATAGIRVFPVGIGSAEGAVIEIDGFSVATTLDEATLQNIAAQTNGTYFRAEDTADLATITESVEREFAVEPEDIEITAFFAIGALLVAAFAGALGLKWTGRMP